MKEKIIILFPDLPLYAFLIWISASFIIHLKF